MAHPERVTVKVYMTPAQAEDLDRFRQEEGGLSRSAMVRNLTVQQLRYRRWRRVHYRSRKAREQVPEKAAGHATLPPYSRPAVAPRTDSGSELAGLAVEREAFVRAAAESIRREPWENADRIHAGAALRSLGVKFSPETLLQLVPLVQEARRRVLEDQVHAPEAAADGGESEDPDEREDG